MSRTLQEVEHAIDIAATHAWEGHGWQRMYQKLGINSEHQLREHIVATVWGWRTECFIASHDREVYYDRMTNTRVILNYRRAGTCLVTRDGAREFARQYYEETDRQVAAGNDEELMPPIVLGGLRALHPEIGEPPAEISRRPSNGDQTSE